MLQKVQQREIAFNLPFVVVSNYCINYTSFCFGQYFSRYTAMKVYPLHWVCFISHQDFTVVKLFALSCSTLFFFSATALHMCRGIHRGQSALHRGIHRGQSALHMCRGIHRGQSALHRGIHRGQSGPAASPAALCAASRL